MAFLKVTVLVAVVLAFTSALPQYEAPVAPPSNSYIQPANSYDQSAGPESPASYSFSWDVNDQDSGNFYGQAEQREGSSTSGEYRVLLPDGRTQIVEYGVEGDGGNIVNVRYEHPTSNTQSNSGGYQ